MQPLNEEQKKLAHELDWAEVQALLDYDNFDRTRFPAAYAYVTAYNPYFNNHDAVAVASHAEIEPVKEYLRSLGAKRVQVRHKKPPQTGEYIFLPKARREAIGRIPQAGDADYTVRVQEFVGDFIDLYARLVAGQVVGAYSDAVTVEYKPTKTISSAVEMWVHTSVGGDQFYVRHPNHAIPESFYFQTEFMVTVEVRRTLRVDAAAQVLNTLYWTDKRYPFNAARDEEVRDFFAYGFVVRNADQGYIYHNGKVMHQGRNGLTEYAGPLEDYNLDLWASVYVGTDDTREQMPPSYTYPKITNNRKLTNPIPAGHKLFINYCPHTEVDMNFLHPAITAVNAFTLTNNWYMHLEKKLKQVLKLMA